MTFTADDNKYIYMTNRNPICNHEIVYRGNFPCKTQQHNYFWIKLIQYNGTGTMEARNLSGIHNNVGTTCGSRTVDPNM